jgi:hypothetical protein
MGLPWRITVKHELGTTDDVLVVHLDGERRALRLQDVMRFGGNDPAVPVSVS